MQRRFVGLIAAMTIVPIAVRADEASGDAKSLAGAWAAVEIEELGNAHSAEYVKRLNLRLTVTTDEFLITTFNHKSREGFTVAPEKKPKHLDLILKDSAGKPVRMNDGQPMKRLAVYEVGKDSLRIHIGGYGRDRPTGFKSDAQSGGMVIVLKRAAE